MVLTFHETCPARGPYHRTAPTLESAGAWAMDNIHDTSSLMKLQMTGQFRKGFLHQVEDLQTYAVKVDSCWHCFSDEVSAETILRPPLAWTNQVVRFSRDFLNLQVQTSKNAFDEASLVLIVSETKKTSPTPKTLHLQHANFAPNCALQKPFAKITVELPRTTP